MLPSVNYEKIEITANGTSIDVPVNQTNYHGPFEDIKLWNWENGALVSYNSHEGSRATVKKYDRDLHPIK